MADVAWQAVQEGIVQPGLGYWPDIRRGSTLLLLYKAFGGAVPVSEPFHLSRAVLERMYAFHGQLFVKDISHSSFAGQEVGASFISRVLHRDTVAHGKVLFWTGGLPDWTAEYAANYVDELGGTDYLSKTVGYALFPSGLRGQPAATRRLNTGAYVILSERATGRQNQDLACAVLAKVMTPAIYSKFVGSTGTLSVLESQDENPFKVDSIEHEASYFWDYAWVWPRQKDYPSLQYLSILDKYLSLVEVGQLPPESAVDSVIREMEETLGDVVVIDP
jgi:inositol-phosphate transport system substrate-binding protein